MLARRLKPLLLNLFRSSFPLRSHSTLSGGGGSGGGVGGDGDTKPPVQISVGSFELLLSTALREAIKPILKKIDEQSDKMNEQSEKMNEQSEKMNEQSDKMNEQSDKMNELHEKMDEQSEKMNEKMDALQQQVELGHSSAEQFVVDHLAAVMAADESDSSFLRHLGGGSCLLDLRPYGPACQWPSLSHPVLFERHFYSSLFKVVLKGMDPRSPTQSIIVGSPGIGTICRIRVIVAALGSYSHSFVNSNVLQLQPRV